MDKLNDEECEIKRLLHGKNDAEVIEIIKKSLDEETDRVNQITLKNMLSKL